MFKKPLAALKSKKGFVGAGILLGYGIYALIAVLGQVDTVMSNVGPVLAFLSTGLGVLVALLVAVLLIVWAVHDREPEIPADVPVASDAEAVTQNRQEREKPNASGSTEEWYAQPKITVMDATFVRQSVTLDGYQYDHCTFKDCTFIYKGEKPFALTNFLLDGDNNIQAGSNSLDMFLRLLVLMKFVHPRVELDEGLNPSGDVAYGYKLTRTADPRKFTKDELWQYCLDLAEELYRFLEERGMLDVATRAEAEGADFELELASYDAETMSLFRRGPKRRVMALLAELQRRSWWDPVTLNPEERERYESPNRPYDIQLIAELLDDVAHQNRKS